MRLLTAVQSLVEEVSEHTALRCRSATHYVKARRLARSFLREARGHQLSATNASIRMYGYRHGIKRLQQQCDRATWGTTPSIQVQRAIQDLRHAESLLKTWASIPDPSE